MAKEGSTKPDAIGINTTDATITVGKGVVSGTYNLVVTATPSAYGETAGYIGTKTADLLLYQRHSQN